MQVVWYRGVPWLDSALETAKVDDTADPVTELARGARYQIPAEQVDADADQIAFKRGDYCAILNRDLVVIGYEFGRTQPEPQVRAKQKGTRGPKSYQELVEWLADDGYYTTNGDHPAVIGPNGARLVTFSGTTSDKRALANMIADCRRILGVELRR